MFLVELHIVNQKNTSAKATIIDAEKFTDEVRVSKQRAAMLIGMMCLLWQKMYKIY